MSDIIVEERAITCDLKISIPYTTDDEMIDAINNVKILKMTVQEKSTEHLPVDLQQQAS